MEVSDQLPESPVGGELHLPGTVAKRIDVK